MPKVYKISLRLVKKGKGRLAISNDSIQHLRSRLRRRKDGRKVDVRLKIGDKSFAPEMKYEIRKVSVRGKVVKRRFYSYYVPIADARRMHLKAGKTTFTIPAQYQAGYRGRYKYESYRNKADKKEVYEMQQGKITPPRVIPPKRRSRYWQSQRRRITLTFIIFSVYAEDYRHRDFTNVIITKVLVKLNTSYTNVHALVDRMLPILEEEIKMKIPEAVIIGIILTNIRVGRQTNDENVYSKSYFKRVKQRKSHSKKNLRRMT
jgi:hypothetical protein